MIAMSKMIEIVVVRGKSKEERRAKLMKLERYSGKCWGCVEEFTRRQRAPSPCLYLSPSTRNRSALTW